MLSAWIRSARGLGWRRHFATLGLGVSVLLPVGCGSQPTDGGSLSTTDELSRERGDDQPDAHKTVVECCEQLFQESTACKDLKQTPKHAAEWRQCQKERDDLAHSKAECLHQGFDHKGICGAAPDAVVPTVVQATCGANGDVIDGSSCNTIKLDSVLAVVNQMAGKDLRTRGFTVTPQPGMADAGYVTAEVSLPSSSPLWSDIGSVELPGEVAALRVASAETLRSLYLALWLRQQTGVRHARPIYGLRSPSILTGVTDTGYIKSDYLQTTKAKLMNLADSWRVLQFGAFAASEVRLAVVDGGFTTANSDLDNPIDIGTMDKMNDDTTRPWHGHWVASAAAAVANNGLLASGTSPLVVSGLDSLNPMPALRVIRVHVSPFWDPQLGAGIGSAIDAGANVINMSFGQYCDAACQFFGYDPVLDPIAWALGRARDNQVIAVASAGNDTKDLNGAYFTPCEFDPELVLCVGSTNDAGALSTYTNFNGGVAVYAPGDFVRVAADASSPGATVPMSGTSLSAPLVSGILSGVVASWGGVRTSVARRLVDASVSTATGYPIIDAAAVMRHSMTVAQDRFEGGDYIDPLPTTGELLSLTDEDLYSFTTSACETVEIGIDFVPLADGATAPYVQLTGSGLNPPAYSVSTPTPTRRVVTAGPLDASTYTLVLGRRPSIGDPPQLPLGYTLDVKRTPGSNCEVSVLTGSQFPTTAEAGKKVFVSATFQNKGATVWRLENYRVMAPDGASDFSFTDGLHVNHDVDPGESFTATLSLTAPAALGDHFLSLRMYHDGVGFFGDSTPVTKITVVAPTGLDVRFDPPAGDVPPRVCLTPAIYRYTLVNQGTGTWTSDFTVQVYRREASIDSPWASWLNQSLGRDVPPGDRITVEFLLEHNDVPGFYEVRADLQKGGVSVGTGSGITQTGIGIYENSDSNNAAQVTGFITPAGVDEGEAGLFEVDYHNSGCNPWNSATGYFLESVAGAWSPTHIDLDVITPVNGNLTRTFTSTSTSYVIQDGESVSPSAWRIRNQTWLGPATDTRIIPIDHAYATCTEYQVPRILTHGQTFPAVMKITNTGGTTWTRAVGYHLGYTPPNDTTWGPAFIELEPNERIEPGQTKRFAWWATAPETPGYYPFFWMMYRDGNYFFDPCGPSDMIEVQ